MCRPEQSEQNTQTKTCCWNPQRQHEQPNKSDILMQKFSPILLSRPSISIKWGVKKEVRESKSRGDGGSSGGFSCFQSGLASGSPASSHASQHVIPSVLQLRLQVLFLTFLAMRKSPRALRCNEPSQCTSRIPQRGRDMLHMQLADAASLRRPLGFRKKRKL